MLPASRGIWWTNAALFVSVHVAAVIGVLRYPFFATPLPTRVLAFISWQAACFSITIGYHRLYSHRSFSAGFKTRAVLAIIGSSACQGSIKWWCLRHRLHHRFTDDPIHDPYSATRGLLWSHMGWIFYKQRYERMERIDKEDLERDPIVRLQHRYFVPLTIFTGFMLPALVGSLWRDTAGAFVWGSLVARICVWHCTFLVNSLAHWDGIQPYSDENTSRFNFIVALLTCGEGNHNFHHAFPHDFRSGPSPLDWDPSKWIIIALHKIGLVRSLRRARQKDVDSARRRMQHKEHSDSGYSTDDRNDPMSITQLRAYMQEKRGACVLLLEGLVVDVTGYLGEHPGGTAVLKAFSVKLDALDHDETELTEYVQSIQEKATRAFQGGMNNHSRAAHDRLRELTIATIEM